MRAALLCLPLLFASPALAQTVLTISAVGNAATPPDEATATLTVQASAADAAKAQAELNAAMAKALAHVRGVPGVAATTGFYTADCVPPTCAARQSLGLVIPAADGVPPPHFAALLSRLQQDGLLLNNLDGALSAAGEAKLEQQAIADAMATLGAQAQAVATQLHERVDKIKDLNVSAQAMQPFRGEAMALAMAPSPAVAPQSSPDAVTAQANVSADINLVSN